MADIPVPKPDDFYAIRKQGRFFALYERGDQLIWEEGPQEDRLVCVCVYKKGAEEVRRRLLAKGTALRRNGSVDASPARLPRIAFDRPLGQVTTQRQLRADLVSDALSLRDESEEPV